VAQIVDLPDPTVAMSLDDLAAVQRVAGSHLTFGMTLACPLRCAHCIVDAAPEHHSTTMPLQVAERYAAQMPELAADGVRSVSFTGGEPTVAKQQLLIDTGAAMNVLSADWVRAHRLPVEEHRRPRSATVGGDVEVAGTVVADLKLLDRTPIQSAEFVVRPVDFGADRVMLLPVAGIIGLSPRSRSPSEN
jgi:hypothetical protein